MVCHVNCKLEQLFLWTMKKLFTAILAVIYIGSSTGATLHLHYCMGQLAEWGFGSKELKVCPGCGMDKKQTDTKGCCKDENKFIKNSTDQKNAESSFHLIDMTGTALLPVQAQLPTPHVISITEEKPPFKVPPRRCGLAVYILNRTFLI